MILDKALNSHDQKSSNIITQVYPRESLTKRIPNLVRAIMVSVAGTKDSDDHILRSVKSFCIHIAPLMDSIPGSFGFEDLGVEN